MYIGSMSGVSALVLSNPVHKDNRGSVYVPFQRSELHEYFMHNDLGLAVTLDQGVAQQTISKSKAGTARGIHFSPYPKLVTCLSGTIADFVVNATPTPTGGHSVCAESIALGEMSGVAIFVPPGVGHGFVSLTDSIVSYLSWDEWKADTEVNVDIMTPELRFYLVDLVKHVVHRSEKDMNAPTFSGLSAEEWGMISRYRMNAD